jgi:hypothetical protein
VVNEKIRQQLHCWHLFKNGLAKALSKAVENLSNL